MNIPKHVVGISLSCSLATICLTHPVCAQQMVRFDSGDSLRILSKGPAFVPNKQPGLIVEYNVFISLADTVALKQTALALWNILRPTLDTANTGFVVLRATSRDPSILGYQPVRVFGTVIEKRTDGKWYVLHDSITVDRR